MVDDDDPDDDPAPLGRVSPTPGEGDEHRARVARYAALVARRGFIWDDAPALSLAGHDADARGLRVLDGEAEEARARLVARHGG